MKLHEMIELKAEILKDILKDKITQTAVDNGEIDKSSIDSEIYEEIANQLNNEDTDDKKDENTVNEDGERVANERTANTENEVVDKEEILDVLQEEVFTQQDEQGEIPEDTQQENKEQKKKPSSKFKSVEELEKAYNNLEKEFTRRSQRLSKLEKELGEKVTETPEIWKAKVDKFFSETPSAKKFAKEIAGEIAKDNTLRSRDDCLEVALNRVLLNTVKTPQDYATDEEFLKQHILGSDFVKKAVIEGYMKDLREGKPPVLMSRSGQNTVAPQKKPKTIEEAGKMFRKYNN